MKWKCVGTKVWYECPNCGYEITMPERSNESAFPAQCPHCMRTIRGANEDEVDTTITLQELSTILYKPRQWMIGEPDGVRADLRTVKLWSDDHPWGLKDRDRLRGAGLNEAILNGVDLRGADLRNASLYKASLSYADLRETDLLWADLSEADLRGAKLDDACWPLWRGSFDVKVDVEIARQLAYHFCRLDCDHPEYIAARNAIMEFANRYRQVNEYGRIEA